MKYDLLPFCKKNGKEVFSYPEKFLDEVEHRLPKGESLMPYGYDSYQEYDAQLDQYAAQYGKQTSGLVEQLAELKRRVHIMNVKEDWAVVRYLGDTTKSISGLTRNRCYYWPCYRGNPKYEGVIDDEEFTSYIHPIEPELWQVLEDPLGITSVMMDTARVRRDRLLIEAVKQMEMMNRRK